MFYNLGEVLRGFLGKGRGSTTGTTTAGTGHHGGGALSQLRRFLR